MSRRSAVGQTYMLGAHFGTRLVTFAGETGPDLVASEEMSARN